jgi:hypothetical protein
MTTESKACETAFSFTTTGGRLLIHRIADIEKAALSNIQSGKSLDRVVSGALASLRDACSAARATVG